MKSTLPSIYLNNKIKYLSVTGEGDIQNMPAGHKSILLLDTNVSSYLLAYRKNRESFTFSKELQRLLHVVHRRQIKVDATFYAMERGLDNGQLVPDLAAFSLWLADFYKGRELFKLENLKLATEPSDCAHNYAVAASFWEDGFLIAYATILKAICLIDQQPSRKDFKKNVCDLFEWCNDTKVAMGIAANFSVMLFAQEPYARKLLKYQKSDSWCKKEKNAKNAARDIAFYTRLLSFAAGHLANNVMLATADASLGVLIASNPLELFKVEGEYAQYSCGMPTSQSVTLTPDEIEYVRYIRSLPIEGYDGSNKKECLLESIDETMFYLKTNQQTS